MEEDRPFRYFDTARRLGESLRDIEPTEPAPKTATESGLDRIASGQTALGDIAATQHAAAAAVPMELQKAEVKRRLEALLAKNRTKQAARDVVLDDFCARVAKLANPSGPDVPLSAMTSGTGRPLDDRDGRGTRYQGVHQGPAANLFAAGLKELNESYDHDREVRHG